MPQIEFDYMDNDMVVTHVFADPKTGEIDVTNYTDDKLKLPYYRKPRNMAEVAVVFEMRSFCEERPDLDEMLEHIGLKVYDPLSICRITRGVLMGDKQWIRFKDDPIKTYDELLAYFKEHNL